MPSLDLARTSLTKSAKGAAARHQSGKELAMPLGGALDTAAVLRELFKTEDLQSVYRPLYHRIPATKRFMDGQTFDREYVEKLSVGDSETATHFVRYFTKLLLAKLRLKMRSSTGAEDVAQETLFRVIRYVEKNGGIDRPEALGAFVNSVCDRVVLEAFREGGRFQPVPENMPEPVARTIDAELSLITDERKRLVRAELAKLKSKDRNVLERVFLLEQDKDAICAELNIDRNYLRVQVHRALGRLRKVLEGKRCDSELVVPRKAAAG